MHVLDLKDKNIVIWGTGREGLATLHFIRRFLPFQPVTFIDESVGPSTVSGTDALVVREPAKMIDILDNADVVIKSPGVSLYHPLLTKLRTLNVPITSLLNLWSALPKDAKTIYVTGTKGKSTTASLITHVLQKQGKKAALLGNIGIPVSDATIEGLDYIIIETSSYQAATFDGLGDMGVLTSLYPEHLDWHKNLETYYRDKLNLLKHTHLSIINAESMALIQSLGLSFDEAILSNTPLGFHIKDHEIYMRQELVGSLTNNHLARHHNLINVCTVLAVMQELGFATHGLLQSMEDFKGLPHRQQELGIRNGVLYVNDSISTTPQSAIAAMESYREKPITLIAGGYDRGIDYTPLAHYIAQNNISAVLCVGPSGKRIADALQARQYNHIFFSDDMEEIIGLARQQSSEGSVILLSPAAPSYGLFKNFEERGTAFAKESGF